MREIKFRAFCNDTNQMYNWDYIRKYRTLDKMLTLNHIELMQFTGLYDKNGVEIFEGDLFKNYQANVNQVIWYWDSWCYCNYHAGALPLGNEGNPYSNNGRLDLEIIGNMYQNPELLEKI